MRRKGILRLVNIFLLLTAVTLLSSLQTSLWFQVLSTFPPPILWLPVIVYLGIYRNQIESILIIYLLSLVFAATSAMSFGILFFSVIGSFYTVHFLRQRIYESGYRYFLLVCLATTFAYHFFYIFLTYFLGNFPSGDLFYRLIQSLLTPLVALPIFRLLSWIDKITEFEVAN
jgi:hypothetical protein